jgi:hypothetical protein
MRFSRESPSGGAGYPSTMLRMVPLPMFHNGEDYSTSSRLSMKA